MKNLYKYQYLILILFSTIISAQNWQWAKQGGGADAFTNYEPERINKMATDQFGNIYGVSRVSKNALFIDGNPQTSYSYNGGIPNGCLVSFDCAGNYRWSKVNGYISEADIVDVKTDVLGNVYIVGFLTPTSTGFSDPYIHYDNDLLVPRCSNDGLNCQSAYIAKYTNNGTLLWVKHIENDNLVYSLEENKGAIKQMSMDAQGNMALFCQLRPGTFFNGLYANPYPENSYHILLLDSDGNFISGHHIDLYTNGYNGGQFHFSRNSLTGDYYIWGTKNFVPSGIGPISLGGTDIMHNLFLAAFNAQGSTLWVHQNTVFVNNGALVGTYVDNADNSLYVTGRIIGTGRTNLEYSGDSFAGATFPVNADASIPGYFDTFVLKLNADGEVIWSSNASKSSTRGEGITLNGNEVAIGKLIYNMEWEGETVEPAANGVIAANAGIVRLNKDTGELIKMTNTLADSNESSYIAAVTADNLGNYYIGGSFESSITAGGSTLYNAGSQTDFYIAKYGTNNCGCQVPTCKFKASGAGLLNTIYFKYQGQQVYDSVVWDFGDGSALSNEVNPTHVYAISGVYNVCLTATNSCDSYNYCQEINTNTLKNVGFNLDKNDHFVIFPNPAENVTFIQYETSTTEALLEVYDLTGRIVARELTNTQKGRWELDTSTFAIGSYIVVLKENGIVVSQKKLLKK